MWKMSKSPITIVLMALMAASHSLPSLADSVKRTPEISSTHSQNILGRTSNPLMNEAEADVTALVEVGRCDLYYDLLIAQARLAAVAAKLAISNAALAACTVIENQLDAFLNSVPPPSLADQRSAANDARDAINAILAAAQVASDGIDAALTIAIAALELAKALCNTIY